MLPSGKKKKPGGDVAVGLLLNFVGVTRLELATSRPPDAYSNQLSYTPCCFQKRCKIKTYF